MNTCSCYSIIMGLFSVSLLVGGLPACALDYGADFNWDDRPLPVERVQREEIHKVIADSLLSPSLDAIAVVRSRPYTFRYVYGQGSPDIWTHRYTFHYDYVFVAESLYCSSTLPDQIAIIQPYKWESSTRMPKGRPDNFMKSLFDYSDEFSLVFLHRDHIFNYRPNFETQSQQYRDTIKNIIDAPPPFERGLGQLGLSAFQRDNAMHSLVNKYSCIRIAYQSHRILDEDKLSNDKPTEQIEERYFLPGDFLKDLRNILQYLSSTGQTSPLMDDDLKTDDGKEIFARISASCSLPVLDANNLRQEIHQTAFESFVTPLSGLVKDGDGRPIPSAHVALVPCNRMSGDTAISSEEGVFSLMTNRSYLPNGRLIIYTSKYAPSFITLPAKQTNEMMEITLVSGHAVNFSIKSDPANESNATPFNLLIFDESTRLPAYCLSNMESSDVQASEKDLFYRSLGTPVLLRPGDYILILASEDGGLALIGKRYINGLQQPKQEIMIDQNIINEVHRRIRSEEMDDKLLELLGLK